MQFKEYRIPKPKSGESARIIDMATATETQEIRGPDILLKARTAGNFIGRPYHLDSERAEVLVSDSWREQANGIMQGMFLLGFFDRDPAASDILLLRALRPIDLPLDAGIVRRMVDFYRSQQPSPEEDHPYELPLRDFGFTGLECRVLGAFYLVREDSGEETLQFSAGVEDIRPAYGYSIFKPSGDVLHTVANWAGGDHADRSTRRFEIGMLRYSSRERGAAPDATEVPVYVDIGDFLGKITLIAGADGTGKSNTVKEIVEASTELSKLSEYDHLPESTLGPTREPFGESGAPYYPVGQILFDTSGALVGPEPGKAGVGVAELFEQEVAKYSVAEKPGYTLLKVNFFEDVLMGFELIKAFLEEEDADYVRNFTEVDLSSPEDDQDFGTKTRWARKRAAYLCCLYRAGFRPPPSYRVHFQGNSVLDAMVFPDGSVRPVDGMTFQQAVNWFSTVWDNYNSEFFHTYKDTHDGREWADEDLKALLVFLTRKRYPGGNAYVSGYRKLRGVIDLHDISTPKPFERDILDRLRSGGMVIIDLSQGEQRVRRAFSEIICREIFRDSLIRFIRNLPNNFIQFYFEDAQEQFPREEETGRSKIFSRLIREGEKVNIGLVCTAPAPSFMNPALLRNTSNWFISRLGAREELAGIGKYEDFIDFAAALLGPPRGEEHGFTRMKMRSSPFSLPVLIHPFPSGKLIPNPKKSMHRAWEKTGAFPGRFTHQRSVP